MYGYEKYIPFEKSEILSRTTEEEIFGIVIQDDIIEDKGALYRAPYRHDNVGDCYFERFNGELRFVDFAHSMPSIDCIEFIKLCYGVTYGKALRIINEKLGLGVGDNLGKVRDKIPERDKVEEKNVKKVIKERVITILPRQFRYKDKQFWSKYEITSNNLIEDKVIPIELFQSTTKYGEPFNSRPPDICYAYTEFEGNRVKIYRPKSKRYKWFTNCNQNDVGSIIHLPEKGNKLVIAKSYKDCRVLRNQGVNSIWFQNEGMVPSREIIINILIRFTEVVVWFDNDNTGITNGRIISEYLNSLTETPVRFVILPPKLLREGIKDPSDLVAVKGRDALLEFMKKFDLL